MTVINNGEKILLDTGMVRRDALEMLHKSGHADAKLLQRLVGQRCTKFNRRYLITSISYGWGGFITARGYRILANGKRGTKVWDIGPITSKAFDDDAPAPRSHSRSLTDII